MSLNRLVAVKVYEPGMDEGDRRFLRESAAAGRLSDHPGIVTAYDAGILPDDRPYLIMALCPGGSLTQWLKPENRPSEERVRQVGVRIADALAAAHACGVLHGDVKPGNILIDSYGNPKLADFGLASVAGAEAAGADALHVTPAYAPPEAFRRQPASEPGDVFSLAATLYALLAGSPPRTVADAPVTSAQMAEFAEKAIGPLPGVNWYLMDLLMTALSNDPAARPTAERFRDQLANVLAPRMSNRGPLVGIARNFLAALQFRVGVHPGKTPRLRPGLMPVRRGVGVAAVLLLLGGAVVFYRVAPGFSTSGSNPSTAANSSASPAVTGVGTQSATPGGLPSSAGPSRASDPRPSTSITTPGGAGDTTRSRPAEEKTIELEDSAGSAMPFQAVRIQGTYRGRADTFLQVQRWEEGKWLSFPLPTRTDQSGQFTAYVELGLPGRYRLRVLDPDSGVTSKPFVLVIKA